RVCGARRGRCAAGPLAHPRLAVVVVRRPPGPTLSPYTTLFRSHTETTLAGYARTAVTLKTRMDAYCNSSGGRHYLTTFAEAFHEDRKSTRLNSSHLGISYAVFCLKKKTCVD